MFSYSYLKHTSELCVVLVFGLSSFLFTISLGSEGILGKSMLVRAMYLSHRDGEPKAPLKWVLRFVIQMSCSPQVYLTS